jgi:hypothetical protein
MTLLGSVERASCDTRTDTGAPRGAAWAFGAARAVTRLRS